MKTKEEILAQKTDWVCEQPFSKLKANVLEAMQLYSDQQNRELREEIGRLNAELMDYDPAHTMDGVTTQAHFLKGYFTAKQLRDIADGIEPFATQRSATDWKRMHNRIYQLSQKQESEIQRLTKEVEELNIKLNGTVAYNTGLQSENTRFRELLVRSNDLISDYEHRFSEFDPNKRDLLVRDIDNALNPKP